jgi:hypothetical protein
MSSVNRIHNMDIATKILLFTPWAGVAVMPRWANRPRWLLRHTMPHCVEWAGYTGVVDDIRRYLNGTDILVLLSKQDLAEYGHTGYANDPISWWYTE